MCGCSRKEKGFVTLWERRLFVTLWERRLENEICDSLKRQNLWLSERDSLQKRVALGNTLSKTVSQETLSLRESLKRLSLWESLLRDTLSKRVSQEPLSLRESIESLSLWGRTRNLFMTLWERKTNFWLLEKGDFLWWLFQEEVLSSKDSVFERGCFCLTGEVSVRIEHCVF